MLFLVDKASNLYSPEYESVFSAALNLRISSKRNAAGRKQSVAAYLLLGRLLGETGHTLKEIEFTNSGKPFIEGGPYISVAHSGNVVCAALSNLPIGIDAEEIGKADERVLKRFFSESEQAFIKAGDPDERFYRLWTIKEAASKLSGRGVGELSSIGLDIIGETVAHKKLNIHSEIYENTVISVCFSEKTGD